jgi:hypothetical protein
MSKCKFNVGDIIVGNNEYRYSITNNKAIYEVVEIDDCFESNLQVKIIYHTEMEKPTTVVFSVQDKYFDLVIPAKKSTAKEMTVAEISEKLGYEVKIVK